MSIQFCKKCGAMLRGKKCGCGEEASDEQYEKMRFLLPPSQRVETPSAYQVTKAEASEKTIVKKKRTIIRRVKKKGN